MAAEISVIIPCLNEQEHLGCLLHFLKESSGVETIVVDGGSHDYTCDIATTQADRFVTTETGRGIQMNKGAAAATAPILLFLHADTRLPAMWKERVLGTMGEPLVVGGAFDLRLDGTRPAYRAIGSIASLRSRLTGVPYGDQAIFVRKAAFEAIGGYRPIPIMEDVDLVIRLRSRGKIRFLTPPVITSARKWERHGIIRTTAAHWLVTLGLMLHISPPKLKTLYHLILPKQ